MLPIYWLAAIGLALSYVGSVYLVSWLAYPNVWLSRDDPRVIKARAFAVLVFSMVVLTFTKTNWTLHFTPLLCTILLLSSLIYIHAITLLGETPVNLKLEHGMLSILLYHGWDILLEPLEAFQQPNWHYLRNFIIGPFAEEVVFRQGILTLVGPCPYGAASLFSLAHSNLLLSGEAPSLISIIVLFTFTFIFGVFVGKVYLQTGSLLTCFLIHAISNRVGFPDLQDISNTSPLQKFLVIFTFFTSVLATNNLLS